jgi:hypothetical protein
MTNTVLADNYAKVTGIDINQETLDIAAAKPFPPGRVSLEVADVQRLGERYRGYTGAFAGFWWSHLRLSERRPFLDTLHGPLAPGAVVVFLDNAYVEGSSTPIAYADAEGNTFQRRKLADGSQHDVLKNFPTEAQLRADLCDCGTDVEYTALDYYWLLKYTAITGISPR